jgi:hypothetical protein
MQDKPQFKRTMTGIPVPQVILDGFRAEAHEHEPFPLVRRKRSVVETALPESTWSTATGSQ